MPAADALNHDRLIDYFTDLVRIDSLSRREGALARRLKSDLEALGAKCGSTMLGSEWAATRET